MKPLPSRVTVEANPCKVITDTILFDGDGISDNDGTLYSHGYAVMEIDGLRGRVEYDQDPDPRACNPLCVDVFGSEGG